MLTLLDRIKRIIELNKPNGVLALKDILIREDENICGKTPKGMKILTGSRKSDNRIENKPVAEERRVLDRRLSYKKSEDGIDYFQKWDKENMVTFFNAIDNNWLDSIIMGAIDKPLEAGREALRVNIFTYGGEFSIDDDISSTGKLGICIRVFPEKIKDLSYLDLPAIALDCLKIKSGLILVTGGTGVGKTTTSCAFIDYLNNSESGHIITIENPIEVVIKEKKSFISQREVPSNVNSMAQGVYDAMREFPDTIFIGEIRDIDSANASIFAGESGHRVIGTMHGNSAVSSIAKMISYFSGSEESIAKNLSQSLLLVISQILVPNIDNTSWVAIYETIILNTDEIKNMVANREWTKLSEIMYKNDNPSLVSLDNSLLKAYKAKKISNLTVINNSLDKVKMRNNLESLERVDV